MKVYSIGRESGCDIVINDSTDVISRRHAVLTVMPSGKMTITDQSHNGTYVNGIRISPNVAVPVTRKDNISFAHVARLDWNRVPKSNNAMRYGIFGVIGLVVIAGVIFGINKMNESDNKPVAPETVAVDSTAIKQREKEKADSIEKKKQQEKADSVAKKKAGNAKKTDATAAKPPKKTGDVKKNAEAKCPTCGKPVSECEYKGKHPKIVVN